MSTDSIHFLINIDGNSNRTHGIENVTQRAPFPAITYPPLNFPAWDTILVKLKLDNSKLCNSLLSVPIIRFL